MNTLNALPPVVYRDPALIVLDKPSGLPSQAPRGGGRNAFDLVRDHVEYAALHHRLDTPASGLLLMSLRRDANRGLARAFQSRRVSRRYLVVVLGDPGEAGAWTTPIQGRGAETRWRRLGCGAGMSLLEAKLITGRTHQVRLHAVGAGHPVLGDRRHGGAAGRAWPRLALHAWRMAIEHPLTRAPLALAAPAPEDLAGLIARAAPGWAPAATPAG